MKKLIYSAFALMMVVSISSCRETANNDTDDMEMSDDIDDAMDDAGDAIEDAADETAEEVDEAAQEVEDELEGNDDM